MNGEIVPIMFAFAWLLWDSYALRKENDILRNEIAKLTGRYFVK